MTIVMSWIGLAFPAITTLAVLTLLGLPIALGLRLKGFAILVVSIPAALAVVALSAIVAPLFGLEWSILPPLGLTIGLTTLLIILRKWIGKIRTRTNSHRELWWAVGSAALSGAVITISLVKGMRFGDAIPQTYDVSFHFNAVRYFLDAGTASPFALDLASPGQATFYPALWHALATLIVQLTGTTIPFAANSILFVICAVIWPIGAVAFGRAIAGPSRLVSILSGIVAVAFPNFPLFFAGYGMLYPNLLSFALLPFVLTAALQLLAIGRARQSDPLTPATRWLFFLGASGAAVLAHPNALHVALLWAIFPVLSASRRALRSRPVSTSDNVIKPSRPSLTRRSLVTLGVAAFAASIPVAWYFGRTSPAPWEGRRTIFGAIFDAAGATPQLEAHAWPVSLLILLGLVTAWRRPELRWTIGSAAVLCIAFIYSYAFPASPLRTLLLTPWYGDPLRLAALITFGAFPLALLGARDLLTVCLTQLRRTARSRNAGNSRLQTRLATTFGLAFLLAATQGAGALVGVQHIREAYAFDTDPGLISRDELKLIERLPEHVPEGERLVNNPWNGGALAYALGGYEVLVPHLGGNYDPRYTELTTEMGHDLTRVCELAAEIDVHFILDFGDVLLYDWPRSEPFQGINGIGYSPILTKVDSEGEAVLYEITGCN